MNFVKRGFLEITRKVKKSLILLLIIFILGNLISVAVSIQQATSKVEETIEERIGTAAIIEENFEAMSNMNEQEWANYIPEYLTVDLIKVIGEISYVKYYDYSISRFFESSTVINYMGKGINEEISAEYDAEDYKDSFNMKGINYAPVLDFKEGKGKLVDGRVFTQDEIDNGTNVTIISTNVAEVNNLRVGDNIVLENTIYHYDNENDIELEPTTRDVVLEIIGLFEPQRVKGEYEETEEMGIWIMDIQYSNLMYVPNELVLSENRFTNDTYAESDPELAGMLEDSPNTIESFKPMYVLNSLEDTIAFEKEVTPLLPKFFKVSTSMEQYDSIAGPIKSISKIGRYIFIIAVSATVLITSLVVFLFIRDRKQEFGIYLSLGEHRSRVVGQVLIEVMVIAFVGITISLFSGNILANQISDILMKSDDTGSGYQGDFTYFSELQTDLTEDDVIENYEVGLTGSYVIGFYVIGLLTILFSIVIPLIYIVRLNPKKILM